MRCRRRESPAFTILELLIVVAIMGVLMAMLLPALGGARRRAQKTEEINALRQVGIAWRLYANSNNDDALPGFLEVPVQRTWNVGFTFPSTDGDIPPAPGYSPNAPNYAGPWPWRLLPFLGSGGHAVVHGYLDEPGFDAVRIHEEAESFAYNPGFGYNAYYIGGWWRLYELPDGRPLARTRFFDATADLDHDGQMDEAARVVAKSTSTIRRSTEVMIFCSSAELPAGGADPPQLYRAWPADQPGAHYVVPPRLRGDPQWSLGGLPGGLGTGALDGPGARPRADRMSVGAYDPGSVLMLDRTAAPIGRYNGQVTVLYADGHTGAELPGALFDMRKWIDVADTATFEHR